MTFDPIDCTQALRVMVITAVRLHKFVEYPLTRMAKRRMTKVMAERDRFRQIGIQAEGAGDSAGDLRCLNRVGQAGAIVIALMIDEDLRLVLQPPEGPRMHDTGGVALKRGAHQVGQFREAASAAI